MVITGNLIFRARSKSTISFNTFYYTLMWKIECDNKLSVGEVKRKQNFKHALIGVFLHTRLIKKVVKSVHRLIVP